MSQHYRQKSNRLIVALSLTLSTLLIAIAVIFWRDAQVAVPVQGASIDATSIVIKRNDFHTIELEKRAQQWHLTSPCNLMANQQRVQTLLDTISGPGNQHYPASEVDREAAGLLTPLATVLINGTEHRVGSTDISEQRRYVQRGDVIELVPEWLLSLLSGGVTALSNLDVMPPQLTQIDIAENSETTTLTASQELEPWQTLQAQQIVSLKEFDVPEQLAYQLSSTDAAGNSTQYQVYKTAEYTVMHIAQASCAYILPPDTLPR